MAKDAKGHGSDGKGKGGSINARGDTFKPSAAGLARAKALQAAMDKRAKGGGGKGDPGYNAKSVNKAIDSAARASGGKPPTKKQRSVTHALLKGNR